MHPERGGAHQQVRLVGGGQDDRDHPAEPGVADLGEQRVVREAAGELGGVRLGALDAQVQGAQAAQREPGLERPGRVALHVAAALEHGVELVVAGDDRAELEVAVAGEVLGRRVQHHVGAELERPLEQRREERVVDDDAGAGVVGRGDDRGCVGHLEGRVGRRLEPDQRGVLARRDHRGGVRDVDERRRQPAAQLEVRELDQGAVVGVPRHDHLVAERDQVEEAGDRGHPGRVGQALPALQRAQRGLEGGPGRVAVAAVLEVATRDVRRRHRDRRVERLVRLVRRPARGHGDGRGLQ